MNYAENCSNSQLYCVYTESMRMLDMVIISQLNEIHTKLWSSDQKGVMNPQSLSLETVLLKSLLTPVRKLRLTTCLG